MKFKIACLLACCGLAVGVHAQELQVGATAVYGFKLKETGISVEAGKTVAPGHFLGLEATYFRVKDTDYFVGAPVYSREHLSTVLALYRFNWALPPMPSLSVYGGAGAGVGLVRLRTEAPAFKFYQSDRSASFAGELQAGVEWAVNKNWAVKLGYRYFQIYDAELFGSKGDIHDNLAEAGFVYRF